MPESLFYLHFKEVQADELIDRIRVEFGEVVKVFDSSFSIYTQLSESKLNYYLKCLSPMPDYHLVKAKNFHTLQRINNVPK